MEAGRTTFLNVWGKALMMFRNELSGIGSMKGLAIDSKKGGKCLNTSSGDVEMEPKSVRWRIVLGKKDMKSGNMGTEQHRLWRFLGRALRHSSSHKFCLSSESKSLKVQTMFKRVKFGGSALMSSKVSFSEDSEAIATEKFRSFMPGGN